MELIIEGRGVAGSDEVKEGCEAMEDADVGMSGLR